MNTLRNLSETIEKMLKVIPKDFKLLVWNLESIQQSVQFTAPETMGLLWNQTYDALDKYVYDQEIKGWREEVRKIFTGEE